MPSFAIVSEGPTDQILLEGIREGFFPRDADLTVNYLSPVWDETDAGQGKAAGWFQVLEYCRSPDLVGALQYNDYVIVQIDTDVCEERHFDISKRENGIELSPLELIDKVIAKLRGLMGEMFCDKFGDRLFFAVSVHSIECWLLPLFGKTKSDRGKTVNCIKTLNLRLNASHNFTIDINHKDPDRYRIIADIFAKKSRRELESLAKENPSFGIFMGRLSRAFAGNRNT